MSQPILENLYLWTKNECLSEILNKYNSQWYCIVNYLYFANTMKYRLFEKKENDTEKNYCDAMLNWDFILPDWIALQVFYYFYTYFDKSVKRIWPQNLNWTDFAPYFLESTKYKKINLILYWAKQEILENTVKFLKDKFWVNIIYGQNWYSEFDWTNLEDKLKSSDVTINVLMVWRWTPLQEIWINDNIENIKKYKLLVFSQWWTFDFWWWVEKRAPKLLVKLRIFETFWRIITNPKKNLPKFLSMFWIFRFFVKLMLKKC